MPITVPPNIDHNWCSDIFAGAAGGCHFRQQETAGGYSVSGKKTGAWIAGSGWNKERFIVFRANADVDQGERRLLGKKRLYFLYHVFPGEAKGFFFDIF